MPNFWEDPIRFIAEWLGGLLMGLGLSESLVDFILVFLGAALMPLLTMLFVIFLIWYERKIFGRMQDRLGPNRVGPWGIFQTFADMGKIFTKELITPTGVDKVPYNLAPILAVAAVLIVWAVIPFGPNMVGVNLSIGLLFVVAAGGIGELAIMMAGWGSNNKYSLLGGFRAVALLVSYEVPMVILLLIPAMLAGSMSLVDIVEAQPIPFIFMSPVAALVLFIVLVAEAGRAPFDFTEAESEIVAGVNVEYSGLKFGMFYVAEFLHGFTIAAIFSTLFLGGYKGPFVDQFPLLGFPYLLVKTFFIYFLTVLSKGAMPRFRIDQLLNLNWKVFTPLALVMVFATALVDKTVATLLASLSPILLLIVRTVVLLGMNLLILRATSDLLKKNVRPQRQVVSGPRPVATASGLPASQEPPSASSPLRSVE